MPRLARLLLLLAPFLVTLPARADIAPEPVRPTWDQHPAPQPDPPPEQPLERLAVFAVAATLATLAAASTARTMRTRRVKP